MAKNILVVGEGGREYALVWKLGREGHNVYSASGKSHSMIGDIANHVVMDASDFEGLSDYAERKGIGLTIVGPENPLAGGIVDHFRKKELPIFGPTRRQARLEASKIYSNELLHAYGIPAPFGIGFMTKANAESYLRENFGSKGFVVKADGLQEGKGVIVPEDLPDALEALERVMGSRGLSDHVLLQRRVYGNEASVTSIVGGGIVTLDSSKDYKPVGKNRFGIDPSLNTGGMGVLSPNPWIPEFCMVDIEEGIVDPIKGAIEDEAGEGDYAGILYTALMITDDENDLGQVIEVNVRFGDPETQALLMRMKSPLLPYLEAAIEGRLNDMPSIEWDPRVAVGAVIATPGYPTRGYRKNMGMKFHGIGQTRGMKDAEIFFAGARNDGGIIYNSGGRVAMPVVLADSWEEGRGKLYGLIDNGNGIGLGRGEEDTQFRFDIGLDAIESE